MPEPLAYEICVGEVLDSKWAAYFAPFDVVARSDQTILTGLVHDQAELFGVLLKISDLGLRLISVIPATTPPTDR